MAYWNTLHEVFKLNKVMTVVTDLQGLCDKISYQFKNINLLEESLTHSSHVSRDKGKGYSNERLEFLGDRVLGLVIATKLFKDFPKDVEGLLARRHAHLVSRDTLAEVALKIGMQNHVILARSEKSSGGQMKPSVLANACEALIAALYLDGGYEAAESFIEFYWREMILNMRDAPKDDKSLLQEWAQGRGLGTPTYQLKSQEGPDHAPRFQVDVIIKGYNNVQGEGLSKRHAEQDAARNMLNFLNSEGLL